MFQNSDIKNNIGRASNVLSSCMCVRKVVKQLE